MATVAEQLSSLVLLDDFNRANKNPMVAAGWTKLPWATTTGKIHSAEWTASSSFATGEDGAYWNAGELKNPAAAIGPIDGASFLGERWIAVWTALDPVTHSGYRLILVSLETGTPGKHEWRVEQVVEGTPETLATGVVEGAQGDVFAITAAAGVIQAWRRVNDAGAWLELGSAESSAFGEGFVGIEGRGFEEHRASAFYGLELEEEVEEEVVAIKVPPATVTASAAAPSIGVGPTPSSTEQRRGLPLPFPSVLANPGRLGPPRLSTAEKKALGLD